MKPRIKLTRLHQKNGPDYWSAECHIWGYYFIVYDSTKEKALSRLFKRMDEDIHTQQ